MITLCKIHEEKFIVDMFDNEYLYFSGLNEFRNSNFDIGSRNDPRELNTMTTQLNSLSIIHNEKEYALHNILKKFKGQYNEHLLDSKAYCCSLHWLEIKTDQPPSTYNPKLLKMGNKILFIYELEMFFKILDKSIQKMGFKYSRKKVEYYDPHKHNGALSLYHKDKTFEFQNEYRILIHNTKEGPIQIPLPGLKTLSCILNTEDYFSLRIKHDPQIKQ